MAIILKNAPKTEESRKLNLTKEQEEQYKIIFRFDANKKELVSIEPWSAEGKYDNYCMIGPLSSTFAGTEELTPNVQLRNVQDSTEDPKPYGSSWIGVIKLVYDVYGIRYDFSKCCLKGYHYNRSSGVATRIDDHFTCVRTLGGHICGNIANPSFRVLETFGLLPICYAHNSISENPYYFLTEINVTAVIMKNPFFAMNIQSALLSLAESAESDGDIEFDVKKYCEENHVEVKDMYFD